MEYTPPPGWLTREQTASILGVHINYLNNKRWGHLPNRKDGRRRLYEARAVYAARDERDAVAPAKQPMEAQPAPTAGSEQDTPPSVLVAWAMREDGQLGARKDTLQGYMRAYTLWLDAQEKSGSLVQRKVVEAVIQTALDEVMTNLTPRSLAAREGWDEGRVEFYRNRAHDAIAKVFEAAGL